MSSSIYNQRIIGINTMNRKEIIFQDQKRSNQDYTQRHNDNNLNLQLVVTVTSLNQKRNFKNEIFENVFLDCLLMKVQPLFLSQFYRNVANCSIIDVKSIYCNILFIKMYKQITGFCSKGEIASKICTDEECRKCSIMCQNQSCECQNSHLDCMMIVSFSSIIKKLQTKRMNLQQQKISLIKCCEAKIKQFISLIDDIKKSIDNENQSSLDAEETKFYNLLKQGKSQTITSNLVHKVTKSLVKKQKSEFSSQIKQLEKAITDYSLEIDRISSKIKFHTIKSSSVIYLEKTFQFSSLLHHPNIKVEQNLITMRGNNDYRMALIEPGIPNQKRKEQMKIKLKIVSSSSRNIYFGVCELKGQRIKRFECGSGIEDIGEDKVILGTYGETYSLILKNRNGKSSAIKSINIDEVIEISYNLSNQVLKFNYPSKKQTQSIVFEPSNQYPLYFCVLLFNKYDKVQLI